ncbi:MAG: hypothetical protein Tsb0027_04690 [Wenzhouxiangellaceae bacterium]
MGDADQQRDFEQLWQKIAGPVRAAVSRHRSRDIALAADDLLQEVRIRVWETCQRDNNSSFNTSYYMRVVNSAIIDCLRRHRGTLAHAQRDHGDDSEDILERLDADLPGPEQQLDDGLRSARLRAAIKALPPDRARAVALYLQGFNAVEIAELMQCDKHRAHNLAYRGARELKQTMAQDDND